MDNYVIELGTIVVVGLVSWGLRKWVQSLEDSIKAVQKTQGDLDKEVKLIKETYVPKADLKDIKEEIISRLERRLERIENHLMGDKHV